MYFTYLLVVFSLQVLPCNLLGGVNEKKMTKSWFTLQITIDYFEYSCHYCCRDNFRFIFSHKASVFLGIKNSKSFFTFPLRYQLEPWSKVSEYEYQSSVSPLLLFGVRCERIGCYGTQRFRLKGYLSSVIILMKARIVAR